MDTHMILWALTNSRCLPAKARRLIENPENEIYYSILSLWEVELKHLAHPDRMSVTAEQVADCCEQSGYHRMMLRERHIYRMHDLQREDGTVEHKDPFDRMLICQAAEENMMFVTHDARIAEYTEPCILAV